MNQHPDCNCPENFRKNCCCRNCSGSNKVFSPFQRYSIIMASAGTGKTYNLAMRYLQLLAFGVAPDEILAVTFTRKAAGEIFTKIITELLKLIDSKESCGMYPREKFISTLQSLLDGKSELRISTIDSFFSRLLQAYAPELGIRNEISIVDAKDERPRKRLLRAWLRSAGTEEMQELRELIKEANNNEQSSFGSAVNSLLDDEKILGIYMQFPEDDDIDINIWGADFPGISKVFTVPEPHVFDELADYFAVYAGTLTNNVLQRRINALSYFLKTKAAGTLTKDVTELLDTLNKNNPPFWLTGVGDLLYSRRPAFIFSDTESGMYIRRAFRAILAVQLKQLQNKSRAVYSIMQKFDAVYSREVRENGILTFSDLPFLLKSSKIKLNIDERLDARLNHYLFDEFQDTSDTQWQIFENLTDELFSSLDDRFRSFFCVGDIKQSIYQWRGGNPELFKRVIDRATPVAQELGNTTPCRSLFESYRSSQDILDVSNHIFDTVTADAPEIFKRAVSKMKYKKHISKKDKLHGFASLIHIEKCEESSEELDMKALIILDTLRQIDPFAENKNLTVGVLQHKNDNIRALADRLKSLAQEQNFDLAVSIDGWISPKDSMAYAVLKQLLILSEHPQDKRARGYLSMLTFEEYDELTPEVLGVQKLASLLGFDDVESFDDLSQKIRKDIFVNDISGFVERFITAFQDDLSDFDLSRINAVRDLAEKFTGTSGEFITAIEKWLKTQDQSISRTVQFMTIHKSKGLEFDIVFIPDTAAAAPHSTLPEVARMEETNDDIRWINYLPNKNMCAQIPEYEHHQDIVLQENAFAQCCKYYVALTRAKRAMYIFTTLPKSSTTFKFEAEMTRQLALHPPEPEYVLSFKAMKNRCCINDKATLIYASGVENWYDAVDDKPEPPVKKTPGKVNFIYPRKMTRTASRLDEHFAPYAGTRFSEFDAADTGTVLHELFEKIDFISDDFDSAAFLAKHNVEPDGVAADVFKTALADGSEIRSMLKKPDTPYTLWKEKRFLVTDDDGAIIPGAFDRVTLFSGEDGVWQSAEILDYKSDNVKTTEELISRHRKQLELYRKCLSKMTGIPQEKIRIYLAALRSGEIAEII